MIPSGHQAFDLDAHFFASVVAEGIERQTSHTGYVLSAVALANPALVLVETHGQAQVQSILHLPVARTAAHSAASTVARRSHVIVVVRRSIRPCLESTSVQVSWARRPIPTVRLG